VKLSPLVAAILTLTNAFLLAQTSASSSPVIKWSSSTVLCLGEEERASLAQRAAKGDVEAMDGLATQHLSACTGKNDPAKGMELLTQAALKGNAHSQLTLGEAYQNGKGVERNMTAAVAWFEKSAAQGNPSAQNDLGVARLNGEGVDKDPVAAAKWFQSAAEQDLEEAAFNLGTLYDRGLGVTQDYRMARRLYQQAAERKVSDAEYRLGLLLEQGLGGEKDADLALRWLRRASKDGSEDAQIKLGLKSPAQSTSTSSGYFQFQIAQAMFEGKGMAKDQAQALLFLEKSADAGYPPAFLALGRIYARGDGAAKDEAKAVGYLEQAIAHDAKYDVAYNTLAWTLVTADDPGVRNPQKALGYASKAVELSGGTKAYQIDTLAHVYFALGNFNRAVEFESNALAMEPDNDFYKKSLSEFKLAKDNSNTTK
jgi:TPR repeat protein